MAKTFTLFIEDTGIKLLEVNGEKVEKWATVPLEPGLVAGGVIIEEAKVSKLLSEAVTALQITTQRVIIGLSGLQSLYRLIDLPVLPAAVLPEAVRREVERLMPVSLNDVYVGHQTLNKAGKDTLRVFVTTFPRDAVDRLARTVRKAGLVPYLMDLSPLALCRTLNVPKGIVIRGYAAVLDIVAVSNKVPEVIRSLSLPGGADSISGNMAVIIEEIERTVAFYNSSHEADKMDSGTPVFVCGALAEDAESMQVIHDQLGYDVSILNSPLHSPASFNAGNYMVNIGLAMKVLKPGYSLVNFNALPEAYHVKAVSPVNVVAPIVIVVGTVAVALITYMIISTGSRIDALSPQLDVLTSRIKLEQQAVKDLKTGVQQLQSEITRTETTAYAINARLDPSASGRAALDKAQSDLKQIAALKPKTVLLSALDQTADGVTLSGAGSNEADIYKYARALREGGMTVVHVATVNQAVSDNTTTAIGFTFNLK